MPEEGSTTAKDNGSDADAVSSRSTDWELQRDANKAQGDAAFRQGDYTTAIHHYSAALSLDPDHAALLSNRSAAYLKADQKSRALHDAQACVKLGTMGSKGYSRLAAALQALGRYQQALENWNLVLEQDTNNAAAMKGVQDCRDALPPEQEEEAPKQGEAANDEVDELDDFFNDVETAVETVHKDKIAEAEEKATRKIATHKKDLGTASDQIERLLAENYKWRNLNPFYVLDIPHTASKDEISQRYKALSLLVSHTNIRAVVVVFALIDRPVACEIFFYSTGTNSVFLSSIVLLKLHPDKNRDLEKAQEAYDEVLRAKAILEDETKANYNRQLAEQGMIQGKDDWKKSSKSEPLESFQEKAVQRIFAEVEYSRRQVEKRERDFEQRERQQEEEQLQKEKKDREFDKNWKETDRVEKRIGNWRDFATKKKKK